MRSLTNIFAFILAFLSGLFLKTNGSNIEGVLHSIYSWAWADRKIGCIINHSGFSLFFFFISFLVGFVSANCRGLVLFHYT